MEIQQRVRGAVLAQVHFVGGGLVWLGEELQQLARPGIPSEPTVASAPGASAPVERQPGNGRRKSTPRKAKKVRRR